jgi:uncharacterized membrane protein
MNLEHIISNGTGLVHLIASTLALISGTMVLFAAKGTKLHKQVGYGYAASMVIMLITSFMMYNLFGKFGIFHWLAVVSTITLAAGMLPMILKRPASYISFHYNFMYWSVFGLYGAFSAEILTRIPKAIVQEGHIDPLFYNLIGVAVFIIMGTGYFFMAKKKKTWARFEQTGMQS